MISFFNNTRDIGSYGEQIAIDFLRKKGYKIIANNKQQSHKEIDIIAQNKEYIAFVEVKTRSVNDDLYSPYGPPSSAVNKKKQSNIITAARAYLKDNPTDKTPRMDVVEVYLKKNTLKVLALNHFENAYHA